MIASASLLTVVRRFAGIRVGLVGDLIADRYVYGITSRVSREAPVLVLRQQRERLVPGGAANAAANAAAMGAAVSCVGVLGDDREGAVLRASLVDLGLDLDRVLVAADRPTTTKTRILAGGHHRAFQQVVRLDMEEEGPLERTTAARLREAVRQVAREVDVLIASDYGFGLFDEAMIRLINELGADPAAPPLLVDSQHRLLAFRDAAVLTPNEPEAAAAAGLPLSERTEDLDRMGRFLLERSRAAALLITRGRRGMSLFLPGHARHDVPIFGDDEVVDVTGAGDTVVATMALAWAAGAPPAEAAALANVAAGLVVHKQGTATVRQDELVHALIQNEEVPG